MLIKCIECNLQVSDKAFTCPHCGFPLKKNSPYAPRSSPRRKRLPNGFGQITELGRPDLRNRYRVSVSAGTNPKTGRPIVKLLKPKAYFKTYNEAYQALVEYNKNPYDLESDITMLELYEKWGTEYYDKVSVSRARSYKAAWNYCTDIYNIKVREIRTRHLKQCINDASVLRDGTRKKASPGTQMTIKMLLNMLLSYAIEYELVDKNYSKNFSLSSDITKEYEESTVHHIVFSDEELNILWKNIEMPYVNAVIFQCYSGLRPQELCEIKIRETYLEEGYIIGGLKTEAGKDRSIPIHNKVKKIVEEEYNRSKNLGSHYLFSYYDSPHGNPHLSYNIYRKRFNQIVEKLNLNPKHRPHDPRKTFVTMAKKYNMDEYALKRIVGHEISDITEQIYTERSIDWLISEMQKIK